MNEKSNEIRYTRTKYLDKAAFLCCMGGKITKIEGKVPDCVFTLEVTDEIMAYEKESGMVNYKKYSNMRKTVKKKCKKASGLPAHYLSTHNSGFKMSDIARFT